MAAVMLLAAVFSGCSGRGQKPDSLPLGEEAQAEAFPADSMVFDSLNWDFGKIDDNAGAVSHSFVLLNPSSRPLRIGSVNVSCSCISADYPHEPIPAGGAGEITLKFMPAGTSGAVYRTAEVLAADGSNIATLSILADVSRTDTDIEDLYHFTISERLLVDRGEIPFGYMYHGHKFSKIIRIANVSEEALNLRLVVPDPGSMLSVEGPSVLAPRSEGEIFLTYRIPDDPELFGVAEDEVLIFADGVQTPASLHTSVIFMAPVPVLDAGPVFWTRPSDVKLEKASSGPNYKGVLEIGNSGEADLHILGVVSPVTLGKASKALAKGSTGKPGETLRLKVSSPLESFTAYVFTDDPSRPYKELIFSK